MLFQKIKLESLFSCVSEEGDYLSSIRGETREEGKPKPLRKKERQEKRKKKKLARLERQRSRL